MSDGNQPLESIPVSLIDDAIRYVEEEIDLYSMEQRATKLREAVNSVLPDRFAALREHVHVPHVQVLRGSEAPVPAPSSAPDAAPDLEGSAPSGGEAAGVDASRVKVEIGDSGGAPPAPVPSCPPASPRSPTEEAPVPTAPVPKQDLLAVWRSVHAHRCSSPFRKPVPAEDAPDYELVIKEPMDLQTLRQQIEQEAVTSYDAFLRAVLLIANNAAMYNGPSSDFAQWGQKLLLHTKRRIGEQMEANTGGMQALPPRRAARRARSRISAEDASEDAAAGGSEDDGGSGASSRRGAGGARQGGDGAVSDGGGGQGAEGRSAGAKGVGGGRGDHAEGGREAMEEEEEEGDGEEDDDDDEDEDYEEGADDGGGRARRGGRSRRKGTGESKGPPQTRGRGSTGAVKKDAEAPVATRARTRKRRRVD